MSPPFFFLNNFATMHFMVQKFATCVQRKNVHCYSLRSQIDGLLKLIYGHFV